MKYLLFVLTLFISTSLFSQGSGIPQQDSLHVLKDMVLLKKGPAADEYLWLQYQWIQWVNGQEVNLCFYESEDNTYYSRCDSLRTPPIEGGVFLRDTLIYAPLPISWEGFMNWKIARALNPSDN